MTSRRLICEKHNFNVITAGRLKCCGMEDRKVVEDKKLICGMEGKMLWLMAAWLPSLLKPDICIKSINVKDNINLVFQIMFSFVYFFYMIQKHI